MVRSLCQVGPTSKSHYSNPKLNVHYVFPGMFFLLISLWRIYLHIKTDQWQNYLQAVRLPDRDIHERLERNQTPFHFRCLSVRIKPKKSAYHPYSDWLYLGGVLKPKKFSPRIHGVRLVSRMKFTPATYLFRFSFRLRSRFCRRSWDRRQ